MDLLLRRRMMMVPQGPPEPGADGRLWAYYNVTDTSAPTAILYTTTGMSAMVVDGAAAALATTYQFQTTGEHIIKFTLSDSTKVANTQFQNCTALVEAYIPSSVTQINRAAFAGTKLTDIHFLGTTSLENVGYNTSAVFYNVNTLKDVTITGNASCTEFCYTGDTTGTLTIEGNCLESAYASNRLYFKRLIIGGNLLSSSSNRPQFQIRYSTIEEVRIGGNVTLSAGALAQGYATGTKLKFIEIGGTVTTTDVNLVTADTALSNAIMHLKYNGVAGTPTVLCASFNTLSKIYVDSQTVLNAYLADAEWSTYASKLDLWSNYNGDYKN